MQTNPSQVFGSTRNQGVPISPQRRCESTWPDEPQRELTVRRRGSAVQGRALETLGHAVEYLADSRIHLLTRNAAAGQRREAAEKDALGILMRASRSVFLSCPEVVTLWDRLRSRYRQPNARARGW